MNTKRKYLVFPGNIESKRDKDVHYISAGKLMSLYGVNPMECIVIHNRDDLGFINKDEYICLYPDWNGNYTLPNQQ